MSSIFSRQSAIFKVLLFIGLPLNIALCGLALGLNNWIESTTVNDGTVTIGLFRYCSTVNGSRNCEALDSKIFKYSEDNWFKASRSLLIGSAISLLIAWIACIISHTSEILTYPTNKHILGWFCFLASLASLVSWALFLDKLLNDSVEFKAGFFMACLTSALGIVNSILSFKVSNSDWYDDSSSDDEDEYEDQDDYYDDGDDYVNHSRHNNINMHYHYPKGYDYRAQNRQYYSNRMYTGSPNYPRTGQYQTGIDHYQQNYPTPSHQYYQNYEQQNGLERY